MQVVVAEDSLLFREGLVRLLESTGIDVVARVGDAPTLIEAVDALRPELVLVDVRMPPTHTDEGLVAAVEIRSRHPETAVMVLSHHVESHQAARLLGENSAGVGYLLKDRVTDLDEFADSIRRVAAGGSVIDPHVVSMLMRRGQSDLLDALTTRERDVLALMAEARSNQAICEHLLLGAKTVETHVGNIFTKLDLLPAPDDHRRVLAVLTYLRSR